MKSLVSIVIAIISTLISVAFAKPEVQLCLFAATAALILFSFVREIYVRLTEKAKTFIKVALLFSSTLASVLLTALTVACIYQCIAYVFTMFVIVYIAYKEL